MDIRDILEFLRSAPPAPQSPMQFPSVDRFTSTLSTPSPSVRVPQTSPLTLLDWINQSDAPTASTTPTAFTSRPQSSPISTLAGQSTTPRLALSSLNIPPVPFYQPDAPQTVPIVPPASAPAIPAPAPVPEPSAVATRSPNLITGDTRRFVDVPAVLEANRAIWERSRPSVPLGRVIPPRAPLPEIFQAIRKAQAAATQITGYDPRNPPKAEFLPREQAERMNSIQFQQYLQQVESRAQKIAEMRRQYESIVKESADEERVVAREERADKRTDTRQAARDAEHAEDELELANIDRMSAEQDLARATQADRDWRAKVERAKASGWITENPTTGGLLLTAEFADNPGLANFVNARQAERAKIDKDIETAEANANLARREFEKSKRMAERTKESASRYSGTPAATPKPATSSAPDVKVRNPAGVVGLIPSANLQTALQRGYTLVQ